MKHSISNSKSSKSRCMAAMIILGTSLMLNACGDAESTAGNYLKNPPQSSSNAQPTAPGATPPATDAGGTPAPATPAPATPTPGTPAPATPTPAPAAGDAAKGNTLLVDCMACHNPTGLGKAVSLNAAAISRLDKAYKTSQVSFHAGLKTTHFEGAGRLDLEAAMKAVTLK